MATPIANKVEPLIMRKGYDIAAECAVKEAFRYSSVLRVKSEGRVRRVRRVKSEGL